MLSVASPHSVADMIVQSGCGCVIVRQPNAHFVPIRHVAFKKKKKPGSFSKEDGCCKNNTNTA